MLEGLPDPKIDLSKTLLTEEQKNEVRKLLHDYRDCFEEVLSTPGKMKGIE